MDLAEAMLRPVDADELADTQDSSRSAGDDWLAEQLLTGAFAPRAGLAPAPTRTQRAARRTEPLHPRLDRTRRPGMVDRPEQPCTSPLPARTAHRGLHAS